MSVDLRFEDLTRNEVGRAISHMPALHPVTVTRIPTVLGGRRFRVEAASLTIQEALDVTKGLAGYAHAVAQGQTTDYEPTLHSTPNCPAMRNGDGVAGLKVNVTCAVCLP